MKVPTVILPPFAANGFVPTAPASSYCELPLSLSATDSLPGAKLPKSATDIASTYRRSQLPASFGRLCTLAVPDE